MVWNKVVEDCKNLAEKKPEFSFSSGGYYSDTPLEVEVDFTDEKIHMNGVGENETRGDACFRTSQQPA